MSSTHSTHCLRRQSQLRRISLWYCYLLLADVPMAAATSCANGQCGAKTDDTIAQALLQKGDEVAHKSNVHVEDAADVSFAICWLYGHATVHKHQVASWKCSQPLPPSDFAEYYANVDAQNINNALMDSMAEGVYEVMFEDDTNEDDGNNDPTDLYSLVMGPFSGVVDVTRDNPASLATHDVTSLTASQPMVKDTFVDFFQEKLQGITDGTALLQVDGGQHAMCFGFCIGVLLIAHVALLVLPLAVQAHKEQRDGVDCGSWTGTDSTHPCHPVQGMLAAGPGQMGNTAAAAEKGIMGVYFAAAVANGVEFGGGESVSEASFKGTPSICIGDKSDGSLTFGGCASACATHVSGKTRDSAWCYTTTAQTSSEWCWCGAKTPECYHHSTNAAHNARDDHWRCGVQGMGGVCNNCCSENGWCGKGQYYCNTKSQVKASRALCS